MLLVWQAVSETKSTASPYNNRFPSNFFTLIDWLKRVQHQNTSDKICPSDHSASPHLQIPYEHAMSSQIHLLLHTHSENLLGPPVKTRCALPQLGLGLGTILRET